MGKTIQLQPVDAIDVTVLVDNSIDELVPSTPTAVRPSLSGDIGKQTHLYAEHGYSLWLTVTTQGKESSLLYDAGVGPGTLVHNLEVLGLQARGLAAVVLSHGHADHHGGLEQLYRRVGRQGLPLILHPDAFLERRIVFPSGVETKMPPPDRQKLVAQGWAINEQRQPSLLLDEAVLVTGQVERTTPFEKGFPLQQAWVDDRWQPDPWLWDDQALVCRLKDKGLVVLTGCSHAGAINIIRQAQRLTGVDSLLALIGGLHLTGGMFEAIIPRTVEELKQMGPQVIVPGHCTGWKAIHALAAELPDAFLPSNVGTRYHFA